MSALSEFFGSVLWRIVGAVLAIALTSGITWGLTSWSGHKAKRVAVEVERSKVTAFTLENDRITAELEASRAERDKLFATLGRERRKVAIATEEAGQWRDALETMRKNDDDCNQWLVNGRYPRCMLVSLCGDGTLEGQLCDDIPDKGSSGVPTGADPGPAGPGNRPK